MLGGAKTVFQIPAVRSTAVIPADSVTQRQWHSLHDPCWPQADLQNFQLSDAHCYDPNEEQKAPPRGRGGSAHRGGPCSCGAVGAVAGPSGCANLAVYVYFSACVLVLFRSLDSVEGVVGTSSCIDGGSGHKPDLCACSGAHGHLRGGGGALHEADPGAGGPTRGAPADSDIQRSQK